MVKQFRIDKELGEGGFGTAYLAYDTSLDCQVVLKEVKQGNREALAEGRNLERVDHPNVVNVRQVVQTRDAGYIVMDLVPGKTLHDVLEKSGPIGLSDWWPILKKLMHGLSAIHSAEVVHRDIHPGNIVLNNNTPVLIDFGASSQPGVTQTPIYHPCYAAPESRNGFKLRQSDLFSLAVVTYKAMFLQYDQEPKTWRPEYREKMRDDLWAVDSRFHNAVASALSESVDDRPNDVLNWAFQMAGMFASAPTERPSPRVGPEAQARARPMWDSRSTETWASVRNQIAEEFGLREDSIGFLRPKTVSRLPNKTVQYLRHEWDRFQWYRRLVEPQRQEWEYGLRDVEQGHALPNGAIHVPNEVDWCLDDYAEACDLPLIGESVARYRRMIEQAHGFPIRSIEFVVPDDVWAPAGNTQIGTLLYDWEVLGWDVRAAFESAESLADDVSTAHAEEIIEDRYGLPRGAVVLLSPLGSHYSGETAIGTVRREYAIPASPDE